MKEQRTYGFRTLERKRKEGQQGKKKGRKEKAHGFREQWNEGGKKESRREGRNEGNSI